MNDHPTPEQLFSAIGNLTMTEMVVVLAEVASLMICDQLRVVGPDDTIIAPDSLALSPLVDVLDEAGFDIDFDPSWPEEDDDTWLRQALLQQAREEHPAAPWVPPSFPLGNDQ